MTQRFSEQETTEARRAIDRVQCVGVDPKIRGPYVAGWARDPKHPRYYIGVMPFGLVGVAIALGRGETLEAAADDAIKNEAKHRRERRLTESPIEWAV